MVVVIIILQLATTLEQPNLEIVAQLPVFPIQNHNNKQLKEQSVKIATRVIITINFNYLTLSGYVFLPI